MYSKIFSTNVSSVAGICTNQSNNYFRAHILSLSLLLYLFLLLEVKLTYEPLCPSVGWLVGWLVGRFTSHAPIGALVSIKWMDEHKELRTMIEEGKDKLEWYRQVNYIFA